MILAWHLVWTCYGWWFPNDPRGSWSKEVWKPELQESGDIEERGRRATQPSWSEMRQWFSSAQRKLKYQPILLDESAKQIVRRVVAQYAQLHNYEILALAVMPEHIHIVVGFHNHRYEKIVQAFKSVSSRQLRKFLCLAALPATRNLSRAAGSTAN